MFKYFAFILLFHTSVCSMFSSELDKSIIKYHEETFHKANYAYNVVNKIYNSFHQWYYTVTFCKFTYFENNILKYLETYGYGYPVMLFNGCPETTSKVKPRYDIHGNTTYLVTSAILNIDQSDDVITALKMTGIFQPRSTVIFVIYSPVKLNNYFLYNMKVHFQLLWSKMVTNSVLIFWSGKLRMYNYNPYLDELKDITNVKDVSNFLEKQYNNLYGHELRLSVFRKIYITKETGPILCNSRLVKTVMESLNATCKPFVPRDGNTIGDLLENGTATGATADLMDGYTDMELNSRILKLSYYGYIETTYPLNQDKLCFIVQNSEKQSASTTIINLITRKNLFIFIFNFIFLIFIAILCRKFESLIIEIDDKQSAGSTMIDLIKCFLKQTVDIKFLGPVFRFLTLVIIAYSLIVNCAVDGIIASAIIYPRFKENIKTMEVLTKTNLILGVHNREFKIFNDSLTTEFKSLTKNRIKRFNDHKIKKFIDERQYSYAVLLKKSEADSIVKKPRNIYKNRELFYVVPDCLVSCFIVYVLRYGSPYLNRINYILGHLYQGGILQYWINTEEYTLYKNVFLNENNHRLPLDSKNMQELFIVFSVGVLLSTIIFILEILVHKIRK